jgi:hypothetical protein
MVKTIVLNYRSMLPLMLKPELLSTQAQINSIVTPHRTALTLFVTPTPIIHPVIVCVVLTGILKCCVPNNVIAPAVSALKPSNGVSLVTF